MTATIAISALALVGCWTTPAPPSCTAPRAMDELNTPGDDVTPALSADRLEIFFASTGHAGPGGRDLLHATRRSIDMPFDPPSLIAELNTPDDEDGPFISDGGTSLHFARRHLAGPSALMHAVRAAVDAPFPPPTALGFDGGHPSLTGDDLTMYYDLLAATDGTTEVFVAMRTTASASFGTGSSVAIGRADQPSITGDGTTLYYRSGRSIYDSPVSDPAAAQIVAAVRPDTDDHDPQIARDGQTLVFSSQRAGGKGGFDLYIVDATGACAPTP
jgi:hypothetical protein